MNENVKPIKILLKVTSNILIAFYLFLLQIIIQFYIYMCITNVFYFYLVFYHEQVIPFFKERYEEGNPFFFLFSNA